MEKVESVEADKKDKNGLPPKVLTSVYEEVRLLKADSLFHLCLSKFANEMMKDESEFRSGQGNGEGSVEGGTIISSLFSGGLYNINAVRVDDMQDILEFTEESSYVYPRFLDSSITIVYF